MHQLELNSKLVTIDVQPYHSVVHLLRLRKADCLSR
jgi:hypothetical protein